MRTLLLDELRPHGLDPAEVGIVGDTAHTVEGDSYHLGRPEQRTSGYAATESPRDKAGLSTYASALDIGTFNYGAHNLRTFSAWLVEQCRANAADTRDIREVIYSLDGKTVKRWDRLGRRSTGDSSHTFHTHISFFRDATKAGRNLSAVFRRYLAYVGLIKETEDMTPDQDARLKRVEAALTRLDGREPIGQAYLRLAVGKDDAKDAKPVAHPSLTSLAAQVTRLDAKVATPAPVAVDAAKVAQALAANTTFLTALAKAVNDDASRRMTS